MSQENVDRFVQASRRSIVEIDCPDVRDLGDRVLGLGTIRATRKGSGVETKLTFATVARYRNGRLTHYIDVGDRDQALEAVGLSG